MDDLRRTLLQLILDNPEIKSQAIYEHPSMQHEENKRMSNFLFLIKKDGQAVADESRRFTITAKGRAYLKDGKDEEAATPPVRKAKHQSKPARTPAADGQYQGAVVELILIEAEANAQAALDHYLATCGDQNIYGPLRAARDAAREALKNYREKPGP